MRKAIFCTLASAMILLSGCLKNLEKEGVYETTRCKGVVLESGSKRPASFVRLTVTNGEQKGESVVTSADGSFTIHVTADEVGSGYYLLMEADSLYDNHTFSLDRVGYGKSDYDLEILYVAGADLPTVSTNNINSITQTGAFCEGTVINDGRSSVTARGICWSTSPSPTTVNSHTVEGGGTGSFVSILSGLESGRTYYVRAYAINSVGTSYGNELSFVTLNGAPLVTTNAVSNITQNSAICGGMVSNDYGSSVTSRGVCWSTTNIEPTINDQHTSDGLGSGSFVSHITNLQSGTHYYVRAYAINAQGIGYGAVKEFTTF